VQPRRPFAQLDLCFQAAGGDPHRSLLCGRASSAPPSDLFFFPPRLTVSRTQRSPSNPFFSG
jgi:hypothetical protein